MRRLGLTLLGIAAIAALSVVAMDSPHRFVVVEPGLVANSDFTGGSSGWSGTRDGLQLLPGATNVLVLESRGTGQPVQIGQRIPRPGATSDHVRVSASLRAVGIVSGGGAWRDGRLLLMSFDRSGTRMWYWPQRIANLTGTTEWEQFTLVVPWTDEVKRMWVVAFLSAEAGQLHLRDLSVDGVTEQVGFTWLRGIIVAGWAGAIGWTVWALLGQRRRTWPRVLAVLAGAVILVAGSAPQPQLRNALAESVFLSRVVFYEMAKTTHALFETAPNATAPEQGAAVEAPPAEPESAGAEPPTADATADPAPGPGPEATGHEKAGHDARPPERRTEADRTDRRPRRTGELSTLINSDKDGHLAAFATFALLAAFAWREHGFVPAGLGALALSTSTQALQSLTVTREPDWLDLAYDATGIALGLAAAALLLATATFLVRFRRAAAPD